MSQIRITPDELIKGSEFVAQTAESIEQELNSLKSRIDEVAANWEGAAQSSFVASFEEIYSTFMSKFPDVTRGIASQMKSAGQALEAADAQVASSFN